MTSNGIATAETTTYLNSMLNELGKQGSTAAKAFAGAVCHFPYCIIQFFRIIPQHVCRFPCFRAAEHIGDTCTAYIGLFVQDACDKVKEFSEWFKNLNESQKQTIIKIAAIVAAIGPALIAFGKMSTGISGIIKTVSGRHL